MIPEEYKSVISQRVNSEKHVIIGSGSTILPGVTLHEGTAIGAMSLVKNDTDSFYIYAGIPARKMHSRSKQLLSICDLFMETGFDNEV